MCDKCDELDKKMERYRIISARITDDKTIEGLNQGAPQTSRITINVFDSLEKAKAWRTGAEYKEARKTGDKYATFRAYVVEGLPD
jgi:uncharacterized protein (DUF1330 family)